jgi:predicted nuclease of predicted toxin-antitoxin system
MKRQKICKDKKYAKTNSFVIVSKNSDFYQRINSVAHFPLAIATSISQGKMKGQC